VSLAIAAAACAGETSGSPDPAIAASGFPVGTFTKRFVEPIYGPSTLAWTFAPDGRWAEVPLDGAPVGARPVRGTFQVDGEILTIVTNYPPGFGSSRHTWRIEGDELWTEFRSSEFEGDAEWFAMLDPIPWTRQP
jgi:hypothetical protein